MQKPQWQEPGGSPSSFFDWETNKVRCFCFLAGWLDVALASDPSEVHVPIDFVSRVFFQIYGEVGRSGLVLPKIVSQRSYVGLDLR